jgi:hypothetical protein
MASTDQKKKRRSRFDRPPPGAAGSIKTAFLQERDLEIIRILGS